MFLNEFGQIVTKYWREIPDHYQHAMLDEFTVMPNHVHGIIVVHPVGAIHELPVRHETAIEDRIYRRQMLLPRIIGRLKMNAAK